MLSLDDSWTRPYPTRVSKQAYIFIFAQYRVISLLSEKSLCLKLLSYLDNHEIVMALFHMECLIPVSVSTKKSTWTPAIVDSRNAFCCTVAELKDIQQKVDQRRDILQLKGMEDHPRIFYVSSQDEYFVQFQRMVYPAENFVDAMDSAFKIIANYHIALPQDSSKIWHFLNIIFYKVKLPSEPTSELISKMSALKF